MDATDSYHPLLWSSYYDLSYDINLPIRDITFRCYVSHKTSDNYIKNDNSNIPEYSTNTPIFIFFHGAGMGALSFSLISKQLRSSYPILSFDLRGHGNTVASSDYDLSITSLLDDATLLLNTIFNSNHLLILVGHSCGGAIITHLTASLNHKINATIAGVVVIDVVEGVAIEALSSMSNIIKSRPSSFNSLEDGIKYYYEHRTVRNLQSARVSFPPLVILKDNKYVWRTDLEKTQPFWESWFQNMSDHFLKGQGLKMLVATGTDRLDTPLTIAQMQGKFQLVLLPNAGHCIQEDEPDLFLKTLLNFVAKRESDFMRLAKLNAILAQKKLAK